MAYKATTLLLLMTVIMWNIPSWPSAEVLNNTSTLSTTILDSYDQSVTKKEVQTIVKELREIKNCVLAIQNEIQASKQYAGVGTFQNPVVSCQDIPEGSPSAKYWIYNPITGIRRSEYCDMTRRCCNSTGGWMRVANLDMTEPNQKCPSGSRSVTSPKRLCGTPGSGCVSTLFPVHGVEYSNVCGRIIGYQYATPDAFNPFTLSKTIDDHYVDGVSLTHGQSPRKHIWTFANGNTEINDVSTVFTCPCARSDVTYSGIIPPFIGQDYFCDCGTQRWDGDRFYTEDPLWDGQGCGPTSTCCSFNNPPWFCKELPQPTSDDIELRLCVDQDLTDEDVTIERVELYVR